MIQSQQRDDVVPHWAAERGGRIDWLPSKGTNMQPSICSLLLALGERICWSNPRTVEKRLWPTGQLWTDRCCQRRLRITKPTVSELCQNPICLRCQGLLFERKQIPQVVDIRQFRMELMESLERANILRNQRGSETLILCPGQVRWPRPLSLLKPDCESPCGARQ